MNEIIMSGMLSGINMPVNTAEQSVVDGNAFKELMSSMMAGDPCAEGEAPVDNNGVLMDMVTMDSEAAADIAADTADGSGLMISEDKLSDEAAAAFIGSLKKFLMPSDTDDKVSVKEIAELWKNVPDSEKKAFADQLAAMCSDDFISDDHQDASAAEILSALTDMCAKKLTAADYSITGDGVKNFTIGKKSDDKSEDDKSVSDDIAYLLMQVNIRPTVINVNNGSMKAEDNQADMLGGVASVSDTVVTENSVNDDALPEVDLKEFIQNVYNGVESADQNELKEFFGALSEELEVQLSVKENAVSNDSAEDSFANAMAGSRQAVMSRIRNAFDPGNEAAAAVNFTAVREIVVPEAAPEIQDISEQIISRFDFDIRSFGAEPKEITMKLAPEELGELEIRIRSTDEGLVVAFAAENSEAAGLIGEKAAVLAEAIAAKGMNLKEMYVSQQIKTNESEGLIDYSQSGSQNSSYNGAQAGNDSSDGKHFVFSTDENGDISVDLSVIRDGESNTEIYYNREAKLWVSA